MPKTMEQLTAAKSGKVLQELRNLIFNFQQNGGDMGEGGKAFLKYMDGLNLQERKYNEEAEKAKAEYAKKAPKCQKCQGVMYCYPVNTGSRDQIGGAWKSYWVCGNPECGHDINSLNDMETELKKYGLGGHHV